MSRIRFFSGAMLFGFLAACGSDEKSDTDGKMVVTGTVTSKLALDNPRVVATDDLGYRVWTYLDLDREFTLKLKTGRNYRIVVANQRADGTQETVGRVVLPDGASKTEWLGANEATRVDLGRLRVSGAASATATVGTLSRGGYGGCDACGDNSGSGRGGYGGGADDEEDDDKSDHDDDKDCHDESESSSGYGGGSSAKEGGGSGYGGGGGSSGRGGHGGADSDDDDDDDKKCDVCAGAKETELEPSKPVGAECADKGHKERKSKGGYGDQKACPLANKPPPAAKPEPPKPAGSSCAQTSQCASACACVAATCETIN